jgi:micrococcal nuclease
LLLRFFFACGLCLSVAFSYSHASAHFSGNVVSILDGDTIEVLHDKRPERVRLNGIDCPEKGQAYGKRAKQATSAFIFGKEVDLQTYGKDKYGRTIADVFLHDGTNVNHMLVKDGWCWWYRKYAPGNLVLEELERRARASREGLWADPSPVPPWIYRKSRRGGSLDLSDMVPESEMEGIAN